MFDCHPYAAQQMILKYPFTYYLNYITRLSGRNYRPDCILISVKVPAYIAY